MIIRKNKKKILFIAPNLEQGGAESVLVKIVNNIDLNKYDIKVILLNKKGENLNKLSNKIEVSGLNSSNPYNSLKKLKKIIEIENPEIVFSIIGHVNLYLSILKTMYFRNIKFIGRENVVYSEWLYKNLTFKKIILNYVYKIYLKKMDIIIVQSQFMAGEVIKFFKVPSDKVVVLNNPLEIDYINILSKEKVDDDLWKDDKINLIAIGRLEEVKNYLDMINVMTKLPNNFHLNILGDGSEKSKIESYIAKKNLNNHVTLHGFELNPYKYLSKSFLLLLTSVRESFPNVVLEANACGIYCVSYQMPGGINEIINKNNINGKLVEFGNVEMMAKEIQNLSIHNYNKADLVEHSEKYSIRKYMKQIYDLFGE